MIHKNRNLYVNPKWNESSAACQLWEDAINETLAQKVASATDFDERVGAVRMWNNERNFLLERLENEAIFLLMRFEDDERFVTAPSDDPVLISVFDGETIADSERNEKKDHDGSQLNYSTPLFVTDIAASDIMERRHSMQIGAGFTGFALFAVLGGYLFVCTLTAYDDTISKLRWRRLEAEREPVDGFQAYEMLVGPNDRHKRRRGRRRTKKKRRKHERRKKRKPATSDAPEVCCKVCSAENKNFDRLRCASCSHVLTDRLIKQTATEIEADEECVICLDEFVAGEDELMVLPCVHKLHFECGEEWLEQHSNCPICKTEIE